MPRISYTANEEKERLSKAMERYLNRVLRFLPEEKKKQIMKQIEEGRAIRIPPMIRE